MKKTNNQNLEEFIVNGIKNTVFDDKYEILTIYIKTEKDLINVISYVQEKDDVDMIYEITTEDAKTDVREIMEWEFTFDDYDFKYLMEGYTPLYMSYGAHYNLWSYINELTPQNIHYKTGMFNYIDYCKNTGLTQEKLMQEYNLLIDKDITTDYEKYRPKVAKTSSKDDLEHTR